MSLESNYIFLSSMDVDPEKWPLLEEIYDTEHLPLIASVSGVRSATRFKRRDLTITIGGNRQTIQLPNEPLSTVLYELDSPEVLVSDAWARKAEEGRWASIVRPYTRNRRLVLLERAHLRS
jgi:hypothetical protein